MTQEKQNGFLNNEAHALCQIGGETFLLCSQFDAMLSSIMVALFGIIKNGSMSSA